MTDAAGTRVRDAGPPVTGWPAAPDLPELRAGDAVHLVGIGGAGMSGLARVLAERGLAVSGCDRTGGPALSALEAWGIRAFVGHDPAHIPADCVLVVRSPAVPDDSSELSAARAAGIPITTRAVLLGALLDASDGVAVAGTHGKTTTSGLLAFIAVEAGLDPTFFVGGDLPDLGTNARSGRGRLLVVEADEYDRTFLHGHPRIAVVTNVELDHPDIYADLESVEEAFQAFVANVPPDGLILLNGRDPASSRLAEAAVATVQRYRVGGEPPAVDSKAEWVAEDIRQHEGRQRFMVVHESDRLGEFETPLPGLHNVENCLAAVAAALALGADLELVRDATRRYRGASRRFDIVGTAGGTTVIDDYAHHPTEIEATLAAARQHFRGRRLWAVVQPHTYSRVAAMGDAYAAALRGADKVIVAPVYGAREAPIPGADAERIARALPGAMAPESLQGATEECADRARAGDVILFLGAGDITAASRACFDRLVAAALESVEEKAASLGLGGEPERDAAVAPYTSLRVGGPADLLVRADTLEVLTDWWLLAAAADVPARVLGRGSNVLVSDAGYRGLVLVNRCEAWALEECGEHAVVEAESGVTLAALSQALAKQGWAGLEASVGIPGSVGAAVVTNAGAHGWSMADSVRSVELVNRSGDVTVCHADSLAFRYRGSTLKHDPGHLVRRVSLTMHRDVPDEIRARIAGFAAARRSTQPTSPSAGSMFKNPPGDYAGRLIEAAGLKGLTIGGAQVSPVHANFFVNLGGATARDLEMLVARVRRAVRTQFDVDLELEIELIGARHAP